MAVFFLDNDQKVIKIVPDDGAISITQTQELPEDNSLMKDILSVRLKNDERLFDAQYMAVKSYGDNRNAFDLYRIVNEIVPDNATAFEGVQLAPYELEGTVIEDLRPQYRPLDRTMNQLLEDTDWRLGYMDDNLPTVSTNFYYVSVKNALKQLQDLLNIEFLFKVEISGNEITDKWVEVYREVGNRTLKRFNYGTNALTVKRETSSNELYTALIGRGKGEEVSSAEDNPGGQAGYGRKINFEDIEWSTDKGNPVNKPKGQKYIELPQATEEYGIKLIDGRKVPRVGIVEFPDTEEPEVLINQTWQELQYYARPRVLFSTTVAKIGDTGIGDTVTIHRHDLNMHYMTRVRKVVRNRKNDKQTQLEIGDVVHTPSTKRQSNINSKLNNIASDLNNVRNEVTNYIISADGENVITFSNDEPERKRVDDSWVRDHPSLAGETQWLVWDGEAWELIMDTSETTKNADAIAEQQQEIEAAQSTADEAVQQIDTAVANAGFTSLDATISSVQSISNTAQANAQTALSNALSAIDDASLAMTNAQTAINRADDLAGQVSDFELTVDGFNQVVNDYEGQVSQFENTVDGLNSTVTAYEQEVSGYNAQVASLENTVNGFNSTVQSVESNYDDLSGTVNAHTTQISNMDGRISAKAEQSTVDTLAGTVNSLGTDIGVVAGQISSKVWNTDIESAIDGIEIGGRNYWAIAKEPWYSYLTHQGDGLFTNSSTSSAFAIFRMNKLGVPIGETYTVSFEIKVSDDAIQFNNDTFYVNGTSPNTKHNRPILVKDKWVKVYATFKYTVENAAIVHIYIGGIPAIDSFQIRNFQLEKGNKATDWTPAPEDTLARFDHIETEWTQTFDSFSQTVSSIDGRVTQHQQTIDTITTTLQEVESDIDGNTTKINQTVSTVETHSSTIATLQTDLGDKVEVSEYNQTVSTVNSTVQRIGNAEGDITEIEADISGLQTTVASKAGQSEVTQLSNAYNVFVGGIEDRKNLLPGMESGRLDSNTGNEHDATSHIRSPYIPINDSGAYIVSVDGSPIFCDIYLYTDIGEFHSHTGYSNQYVFVAPEIKYIRVLILTSNTNLKYQLEKGYSPTEYVPFIGDVSSTQISMLQDNINLRVEKGDVLSQINIEAERTLIQSNRLLLNATNTVITGTAWMDGAVIANASIDGAKIADATIGSAKIASLDVSKISGDTSEFVKSNWNSATGGNVQITGDGILTVAPDMSQVQIARGMVYVRNSLGNNLGQIGRIRYTDDPVTHYVRIRTSWGTNFAITQVYNQNQDHVDTLWSSIDDSGQATVTVNASLRMNHQTIYLGDNRTPSSGYIGRRGRTLRIVGPQGGDNESVAIYGGHGDNDLKIGYSLRTYYDGNISNHMWADLDMHSSSIVNPSDERLKTKIVVNEIDSLTAVKKWKIAGFNWIDTEASKERQFGLIAQSAPEVAFESRDGYLNVNSSKQLQMTTHAVQQLAHKHDTVAQTVANHTDTIHTLQQELSKANRRIKELEEKIA